MEAFVFSLLQFAVVFSDTDEKRMCFKICFTLKHSPLWFLFCFNILTILQNILSTLKASSNVHYPEELYPYKLTIILEQ